MTPRVSVRLFPPQAARLDELAAARGMTRSALLRTLILEATLPGGGCIVVKQRIGGRDAKDHLAARGGRPAPPARAAECGVLPRREFGGHGDQLREGLWGGRVQGGLRSGG